MAVRLPIHVDVVRVTPQGQQHVMRAELGAERYSVGRSRDCSIILDGKDVSRVHLILDVTPERVVAEDNGSTHGTLIGGDTINTVEWDLRTPIDLPNGYQLRGVPQEQSVAAAGSNAQAPRPLDSVEFSRIIGQEDPGRRAASKGFPFDVFKGPVVALSSVLSSGYYAGECEYLALGGGNGSFAWVDHLRIYGVPASAIRVLGISPECYANWSRYCQNSQIPPHERIRSNSASVPDNIWGFPGYASREAWRDLKRGKIGGVRYVWQVFGEPAVAETFTPRLADVYSSLDREMKRVGWKDMFVRGRILALRKLDDGRYAVAYRVPSDGRAQGRRDNIIVARTVHVATGYPATRFTDDLQRFKADHQENAHLAVNAYDPHDELYFELEHSKKPETVVVRGRGIVASRVIQRLYEARARNPQIQIIHQMRSRVANGAGSKHGRSRRPVFSDVEYQPFNWPKSSWGGQLLRELERRDPEGRSKMIQIMGGTTTADRKDWKDIINEGTSAGWYRKLFGNVRSLTPSGSKEDRKLRLEVATDDGHPEVVIADYIVDCTGLIADVRQAPFLSDLVDIYQLPLNKVFGPPNTSPKYSGIAVSNHFEVEALRNGDGRVYAAGTIVGHGPHAAVDSLLGLQYAALRSVDHLASRHAPGLRVLGPGRSFSQWMKWCRGVSPDGR